MCYDIMFYRTYSRTALLMKSDTFISLINQAAMSSNKQMTPDLPQTFKVNGSNVKVIAWYDVLVSKNRYIWWTDSLTGFKLCAHCILASSHADTDKTRLSQSCRRSWLVSNSVHTANTNKTIQNSLVLSVPAVRSRHIPEHSARRDACSRS